MFKTLFVLLVAITTAQSFVWIPSAQFFDENIAPINWSYTDWVHDNLGVPLNVNYNCGGLNMYGGFDAFGEDYEVSYENLLQFQGAPHDFIRISFKLSMIDSWDTVDSLEFYVQNQLVNTFTNSQNDPNKVHVCGSLVTSNPFKELFQDYVIILPHSTDDLQVKFVSIFDQGVGDESWGISNFLIEYNPTCPQGETWQNGGCVDIAIAQACYDNLTLLDPSPTDNTSIDNECESNVVNDQHIYTFTISYIGLYSHDDNCVSQDLYFGGNLLTQGTSTNDNNEWEFNDPSITFKVKHSELISQHNCVYETEISQFKWTCQIQLDIIYNGYVQLSYQYTFCVYLPRDTNAEVIVAVYQNTVIETDCCENTLQVDSVLEICADIANDPLCTQTLPSNLSNPQEFERGYPITVKHSITTSEFLSYYLDIKTFTYGPFTPIINAYDGSNQGFTIVTFTPDVAINGIFVNSIAQLSETASTWVGRRRRMLNQGNTNGERFNSEYSMSVKDTEDMVIQQDIQQFNMKNEELIEEEKETQEQYQMLMITTGILSTIVLLSIIASLFYCKRNFTLKEKAIEQRKTLYQDEPESQQRKLQDE